MTGALTSVFLTLTPLLPLALSVAVVSQRGREVVALLLPLAPLPALGAALIAAPGADILLPSLLLGLDLGIDENRRLLLEMTALLWIAAGFYGRGYIPRDARQHRYNAFFLATMGGNLGLIVALDAPGFYLFFSLMTLSSYILVVFEGSARAYAAGRVYLVLSLLGEMALLFGLLRAVEAADSLMIADIPAALAEGEEVTLLLLFAGFALKAGQLPLHVWLPLAHPAAPTPASAVLSGAMIKAGLLGMILFLPLGEASLPSLGLPLAVLGLATAFYGVLCGLSQTNPKTVLAYSSLSQMGLLVAALGVILSAPGSEYLLLPAVVLYAMHHGFSKAALFLSVGVVQRSDYGRSVALVVAGIAALAIAGGPLTAGGLVKFLLKKGVETGQGESAVLVAALLSWSAVATTLLMLRFLLVLAREPGHEPADPGTALLLWGPFLLLALLGQVLPWTLTLMEGPLHWGPAISAYGLWESSWPILLALGLALLWRQARRAGLPAPPSVPEGDWIVLLPTQRVSATGFRLLYRRLARPLRRRPQFVTAVAEKASAEVARLDAGLQQRRQEALALVLLAAAVGASLLW